MRKRYSLLTIILCVAVASSLTFTGTLIGFKSTINNTLIKAGEMEDEYEKLQDVEELIKDEFVHEFDDDKLETWMLTGLVHGLEDDYSYYLDEEAYADATYELTGNFEGIGIRVNYAADDELIRIVHIMSGSPANNAGLMPGDLIVQIEGESVAEMGYEVAVDALLGEGGTDAIFTVDRDGELIDFSVTRDSFMRLSVEHNMMDNGYGYIRILEFDYPTYDQFLNAVQDLMSQGVKGIVFDVRNNLGGELNTIVDILDTLVPSGNVIEIVYKDGTVETMDSGSSELNLPMAVLINGETYSAAELFAATLRDYDKAILVGDKTFGKGSMQTTYPLGDGTAVHLTNALYNPPSGINYNGIGVFPHIDIALPEELEYKTYYLTYEEDTQLQAAIEALESGMQAKDYPVKYE